MDKSSFAYNALRYGNDLIDEFKNYYELKYERQIPRPHLFVINEMNVNAFAVYEKKLSEYCIGINLGAFQRIKEKTEEIVDMIIEKGENDPKENQLISLNERDKWIEAVYIDAMCFFVAHEYSHILNGHIKKDSEGYFEFLHKEFTENEKLFQQMKEFDADETAMNIICYMIRSVFELKYRKQSDCVSQSMCENNQQLKKKGFPEILINMQSERYINAIRQLYDMKIFDVRRNFKYLMLGVNVVFLVLDERRLRNLNNIADNQKISQEDRTKFYYLSGLQLIRAIDHPLPSLRLDAVIRIMDENIEAFEGIENADEICKDVADYVWKVEFWRCDNDASKLYTHIAHTPTAQDFIQEIETLWQEKKNEFEVYINPLERLFYKNRIIDMYDDGVLA